MEEEKERDKGKTGGEKDERKMHGFRSKRNRGGGEIKKQWKDEKRKIRK